MSKKQIKLDTRQQSFDFDATLQEYEDLRAKLLCAPEKPVCKESFEEACIEIAGTVKHAVSQWGRSREEMVDAINLYFGASDDGTRRKHLSIHMFNHYLSKPVQYPLPAALIFAIQHITGSLATIATLAKSEQARVIDKDEVNSLAIGKLDTCIAEMQRLKKEFRGIKK
jgi:hypothetical protein